VSLFFAYTFMIFCAVYTRCTEYRTLCHCSEGRTHRGRLNVTHSKSKTLEPISTADCAQIAQTSAKASKLSQKWSEIQIRISRLIRMRIRMSARSVPKCVDSSSYQHQSLRRVSWKSAGDYMRNANKSPKIFCSTMVTEVEQWSGIYIRERISTKS